MLAPDTSGTVFIVDDDEAVRDSLCMLMESVTLTVESFDTAAAFLARIGAGDPGCLVLDIRMPGMSGFGLRDELRRRGIRIPIIFITGHGDVPMAVDAMKHGAVDFLPKPFGDQDLLKCVQKALTVDREFRETAASAQEIRACYATLTPRETQVMQRVVAGDANKVIALDLEVSQRTVEIHRARVMRKMQADSIAHLVRMAAVLEQDPT